MKVALFALVALFSVTALAQQPTSPPPPGANFETHKGEVLTDIDQRIQKLQEHKTCVGAATNHDGMKKCHESMKEFRMGERAEQTGRRKDRMEKRQQKLDEAKKKLEEKAAVPTGQ